MIFFFKPDLISYDESDKNGIYIYKRLRPRKKIRNRKNKEPLFIMKLNTKPLKFKCGLADGGGGRGGLADPCKAWVPPPSS